MDVEKETLLNQLIEHHRISQDTSPGCFTLVESTICPWGGVIQPIFMIRSLNLLKHLFYAVLINAMIAALICSGSSGQTVTISARSDGSVVMSISVCF